MEDRRKRDKVFCLRRTGACGRERGSQKTHQNFVNSISEIERTHSANRRRLVHIRRRCSHRSRRQFEGRESNNPPNCAKEELDGRRDGRKMIKKTNVHNKNQKAYGRNATKKTNCSTFGATSIRRSIIHSSGG